MTVFDLPFGGRNIRLYTYDPGQTPMYNTGHYDLCNGPAVGDPQAFNTWDAMDAYTKAHGEAGLVLVTRDDLPGLEHPNASDVAYICAHSSLPVTSDTVSATVAAQAAKPSQSPVANSGVQGGSPVTVYRFIALSTGPYGGYDTGANHANCSPSNPAACDPQHFATLTDAYNFAVSHNEVPVMVSGSDQAFAIIAGQQAVTPDMVLTANQAAQGGGLSTAEMLLLAGAAFLLLR